MDAHRAYWLSFFLAPGLWGMASIIVRGRSHGSRQVELLNRIQIAGSLYGAAVLVLAPAVLAVRWFHSLLFAVLATVLVEGVPRLLFHRSQRQFHQLRGAISWFLVVALLALFAWLTGDCIWWTGAAIFAAAGIWNLYAEYSLKPAIQEFYSDVDDVTLWTGPLLPEEAPVLLIPLTALFLYPLGLGDVSTLSIEGVFRGSVPLLSVGLAVAILAALMVSLHLPDDYRRLAAVRCLNGLALLLVLVIGLGSLASLMPDAGPGVATAGGAMNGSGGGTGACLAAAAWSGTMALMVGVLPLFWVLLRVFAHRPEYDLFISFASPDRSDARVVAAASEKLGLRYFFSDEDIYAGTRFRDQLRKAVRNSLEVAVLYTPASRHREWVVREYTAAWVMGKRVCPILRGYTCDDLDPPLEAAHCVDYDRVTDYLREVGTRARRSRSFLRRGDSRPQGGVA